MTVCCWSSLTWAMWKASAVARRGRRGRLFAAQVGGDEVEPGSLRPRCRHHGREDADRLVVDVGKCSSRKKIQTAELQ